MAKYIDINEPVLELYERGIGVCEISKRLEVSRWKILKTLKDNNIKTERITRPYKNFFNIKFFNEYNEYSCYWAGFIMADGNIHTKRKNLSIALSSVDKEHLLKFKNNIDFTGPISDYISKDIRTGKSHNYSKITIGGKWFALDLESNFNVVPSKTLITKFPIIPEELISYFIRGYFDGDGSIVNRNGLIIVSMLGTFDFLKGIQDFFYKNGIRVKGNSGYGKITDCGNIYSITYSGSNASKFLDIIYKNSNIHLDRKYDKYKKSYDIS